MPLGLLDGPPVDPGYRATAEAIDQHGLIVGLQVCAQVAFLHQSEPERPATHHAGQAAAGQGWSQPLSLPFHQQVGNAAAAQFFRCVEQQGIVGSGQLGFAARLDGCGVAKGFAAADQAGRVTPLPSTGDD